MANVYTDFNGHIVTLIQETVKKKKKLKKSKTFKNYKNKKTKFKLSASGLVKAKKTDTGKNIVYITFR